LDVWFEYGADPSQRLDLLLTLNRTREPGELYRALDPHLGDEAELAYNQSTVAAKLTFPELVRIVLPLAVWRLEFGTVTSAWLSIASAGVPTRNRERAVRRSGPLPLISIARSTT